MWLIFSSIGCSRLFTCSFEELGQSYLPFLISNIRLALNAVCLLLNNSPASEFYMLTFRNTLFHLHRLVSMNNNKV
jgi:hypothetical protein